ncbi:MAG TPA: hypothetical protein VG778_11175 [Blastocatellia bacterium]|nr:hypothetical protein [Blastocatellia bacterium]
MYCPSCGSAVQLGLSYCTRCGAEVKAIDRSVTSQSSTMAESLIWAIVAVTVGGLGVVVGLMAVMGKVLNLKPDLIVAFSLLSFLILLGADSVFIWLLLRSRSAPKVLLPKSSAPQNLDESSPASFPEPVLSVTEHTTRTLEPSKDGRDTE